MNLQQFFLLLTGFAVPAILFALKKSNWVLGWVCITMSVHIFDTQLVTNLAASRIVGLMYLPMAIATYRPWLSLQPAKVYLLNFFYLLMLGVTFGFIFPWPDTTGLRPFTLTASGRVIIYTIRTLADLSLTIFIFNQLKKPYRLLFIGRTLILGSLITAFFGAISLMAPQLDFYHIITGLRYVDLAALARGRGLSYEPRGLGMACAYGILVLLIYPSAISFKKLSALVTCVIGFVAAFSASSLALLVGGILASWYRLPRRAHVIIRAGVIFGIVFSLIAYNLFPARLESGINNILIRVNPTERLNRLGGVSPKNFAETIAFQLDGFDGSALLFLFAQPLYAVIGTGPTMIYLPASNYLLPGAYTAIYSATGINSPPTHGFLLELSNSGIVGVILWFVQIILCYQALHVLSRRDRTTPYSASLWRFGRTLFLIGVIFYLIQVSQTSPIWNLILAIGWAGVYHRKKLSSQQLLLQVSNPELPSIDQHLYA